MAFPTETVYGVAVNAANDDALARLRELKSRPDRPFTVHIGKWRRWGTMWPIRRGGRDG